VKRPPGRSHRRVHGLTALLVILALAALSLLAACGGGGGGGSTPTSPPPPPPPVTQPSVTFTPAAAAGAGSIALGMGAGSTPTSLLLEVRSGGLQDLYGVAFDLQYPANLLQLTGVTSGPLLSGGTFQQSLMSGNVILGVSRLGVVPGVSDSGVIATLQFKPLVSGTGLFSFSRNTALDSAGKPITVTWIAGSVTTVVVP
jgi:hypothetical protein